MWGLAVALAVLFAAGHANAQCCACQACAVSGFCVDGLANSVACATLCGDAGCSDITFQSDDDCTLGCDGQPDLPTATPSGTPTGTPTGTAAATATETPSGTPTLGSSATATHTGVATATHTTAGTAAATPTGTPTGTAAATATDTPSTTPTGVPTGTATATATLSATSAGTPTGTPTGTTAATATHTVAATATHTAAGTETTTPSGTPTGTVAATATPTATPTATASSTASPTQAAKATVVIGTAVGGPGFVPGFAVTFSANVPIPAGTVCVGFDRLTPIRATAANEPDCTAQAVIPESIDFQPEDCDPHVDCTVVCAALTAQTTPPTDVTLMTCRVAIDAAAPLGTYPLTCTALISEVDTTCTPGSVIVQNNLPGDCNGDGVVTIDELILGVNISLDLQPITACPAFDTDFNGSVSVDELIKAVNVALTG